MSDYLCEELIHEIFERLPPKSLLRFRCLSQSWCSRISSPDFIRMHARRSSTRTFQNILVRQQIHFTKENVEYGLHRPKDQYKIPSKHCVTAGSCCGIILLQKYLGSPKITLWNPSIRRKLTIPNHPYENLSVALGFGYDLITNDYKIVGIYNNESVKPSILYSMKTNSWSEIALPTPLYRAAPFTCFFNGFLHWVVQSKPKTGNWYIMTFDLSSHVFGMISLPKPSWVTVHLTIIEDSLAVISDDGYDSWMFVMREYNNVESWSKSLKVPTPDNLKGYNPFTGVHSIIRGCSNSSYIIDMDFSGESLELLGMERC